MRISLIIFVLAFSLHLSAQDNNTPPSKQKIQDQLTQVTKKLNSEISDLEKQIAEAEKNKEPAESVKLMKDQLAMLKKQVSAMNGVTKGMKNMSEKTIQQATEENEPSFTIPKRDNERIKMLPDRVLTDQELVPFLKNVITEVEKKISSADKQVAAKLEAGIKSKENYKKDLAAVANACWLSGHPQIAIYLMGKVCIADINNPTNLNNYAAFLEMAGAEHAALPILQNLNSKYPNNSTILNNIGQAWYGLGDMNNAKKNLENSLHFFGVHSQANLTMCEIQQSEGKKQEAIESLKKSIEENYTSEKESRLNKLGGMLNYDDIKFPYTVKAEPLGIEGFFNAIPEYAFQGGAPANLNKLLWDDFVEKLDGKAKHLESERKQLEIKVKNYSNQLLASTNQLLKPYNNYVHKTASRKYTLLVEWATDRLVELDNKRMAAIDSVKKWKQEYTRALANVHSCEASFDLATQFNSKANSLWQQVNSQLLSFIKKFTNARANLYLYVATDQSIYELELVSVKLGVLNFLSDLHREYEVGCIPITAPKKPGGKLLPDFDSVNCQYRDSFSIGYFTRFKFDCNKMTTKLHLGIDFNYGLEITPYIDITFQENLTNNTTILPSHVIKSSIEIGAEIGADKLGQQGGIHEAEAKIEGAIGVEFEHGHLEGVYVKAGAKVDVGPSVEGHGEISNYQNAAGIETELKWNAGNERIGSSIEGKFEGKGFLRGIHLSTGPISLK